MSTLLLPATGYTGVPRKVFAGCFEVRLRSLDTRSVIGKGSGGERVSPCVAPKRAMASGWYPFTLAICVLLQLPASNVIQAAQRSAWSSSSAHIQFEPATGRVSADLSGVPLTQVIEAISLQADVQASVPDSVGKTEVWVKFESISLDQAVGRILKGQSYLLLHAPDRRGRDRIVEIRIIGEGGESNRSFSGTANHGQFREDRLLPSVIEGDAITALDSANPEDLQAVVQASLEAAEPDDRVSAIQDLVRRADELGGGTAVVPMLEQAARDSVPMVREVALESLDQFKGNDSVFIMIQMALQDQSPDIRGHAMQIVVDRDPELAADMLTQAINDPDPDVSELARDLLGSLDQGG